MLHIVCTQLVNGQCYPPAFGEGRQRLGLQTTECKCEYGSYQSFFHYFRLYVRMRLLAERISKHSAKGNIAGGILCGIIAQSPIKSVKTAKLTSI